MDAKLLNHFLKCCNTDRRYVTITAADICVSYGCKHAKIMAKSRAKIMVQAKNIRHAVLPFIFWNVTYDTAVEYGWKVLLPICRFLWTVHKI